MTNTYAERKAHIDSLLEKGRVIEAGGFAAQCSREDRANGIDPTNDGLNMYVREKSRMPVITFRARILLALTF